MVPPALQWAAPPGTVAKRAVRNLGDMVGEEVAMTVQARYPLVLGLKKWIHYETLQHHIYHTCHILVLHNI